MMSSQFDGVYNGCPQTFTQKWALHNQVTMLDFILIAAMRRLKNYAGARHLVEGFSYELGPNQHSTCSYTRPFMN